MDRYCMKCGAKQYKDSDFCVKCGNKINQKSPPTSQTQTPHEKAPKSMTSFDKSNKKMLMSIFSILIVVVVVAVVVFLVLSNGENVGTTVSNPENIVIPESIESKFVGIWEYEGRDSYFEFYNNGSLYEIDINELEQIYFCSWEVSGDTFCFIYPDDEECTRFKFSNDYKTLSFYSLNHSNTEPLMAWIIISNPWNVKKLSPTFRTIPLYMSV